MATDQGLVYATFIEEQLAWEKARQISLDERGTRLQQTVGLTSGLLVAGTGVVATEVEAIGAIGRWLFALTFIPLACAFMLGSIATRLRDYEVADPQTLYKMVGEHWGDGPIASRSITAYINIKSIDLLRSGNNKKAQTLQRGIVAQGIGAALSVVTFAVIALSASSVF